MFTSSSSLKDVTNTIIRELGDQIQHLRTDVLSGHGKPSSSVHVDHHAHEEHHSSILTVSLIKIIAELFSVVGVTVMIFASIGIVPIIVRDIIPAFLRPKVNGDSGRGSLLLCRMQLARGIMLGMDFMVAADVIETLLHQIDLVKLLCIIAIRSWLGFERAKEAQHLSHEYDGWKKVHPLLAKHLGDLVHSENSTAERIRETFDLYDANHDGWLSKEEIRDAFKRVGLAVNEKEISEIFGEKDRVDFESFDRVVRKIIHDCKH
jgi:Ca2+-binding EF-hand superfamily protein